MITLKSVRHQYLTLLWTVFILVICDIRLDADITGMGLFFEGFDKLTHTGCFFTLTVLLLRGRIRQRRTYAYSMGTILTILVVCASLGGAIELLQEFVFTYRSGEWWDIFCDMLGCLMALFGYVCMRPLHPAERNPTQET